MLAFFNPVNAQTKDPGQVVGTTGAVTFIYKGQKTTLTTVRTKDGNVWLQQDLGSRQVGKMADDVLAFGDLFQWGRWDDGHQQRDPVYSANKEAKPSNPAGLNKTGKNPYLYNGINAWWLSGTSSDTWTASTPAEATETNGCDPCRALGAGWHLPSIEEWQAVLQAEEITDGSSSDNSNLKLTYSGQRDWNGITINNRPRGGFYWSSTPANQNGGAKGLMIYAEGVKTSGAMYRGCGNAIRCLKSTKN